MTHINPTLPAHGQTEWDTPLLAALQALVSKANSLDDVIAALALVASTGSYADLAGRPTLSTVASSGAYADLTGKPLLATVATSGSYADLSDKPTSLPGGTTDLTGYGVRPTLYYTGTAWPSSRTLPTGYSGPVDWDSQGYTAVAAPAAAIDGDRWIGETA